MCGNALYVFGQDWGILGHAFGLHAPLMRLLESKGVQLHDSNEIISVQNSTSPEITPLRALCAPSYHSVSGAPNRPDRPTVFVKEKIDQNLDNII